MQTLAKNTTISAQNSRPNGNIKIGGRGVGDALIAGDVIEGSFFSQTPVIQQPTVQCSWGVRARVNGRTGRTDGGRTE